MGKSTLRMLTADDPIFREGLTMSPLDWRKNYAILTAVLRESTDSKSPDISSECGKPSLKADSTDSTT